MGPLAGVRIIEIEGLGPGPFAGMMLADMGAEVLVIGRAGSEWTQLGALNRGKRRIGVDLKHPAGVGALLDLLDTADVLVDVFRPGVAERLGFGPDVVTDRNPRLIYARLTGFGQSGPWSQRAGHDLGYLAVSGTLEPLGREDGPPTAPINVLADFAGGGTMCVVGILGALVERASSGSGQTIDVAMVDGAALTMAPFFAGRAGGWWGPRGTNLLDGAAHFYDTYATSDGRWLSVAAIEPQFYAALLEGLGLAGGEDPADQYDQTQWPQKKALFAAVIAQRSRDEWMDRFATLDACVEPALTPEEAPAHPHAVARRAFRNDPRGLPEPNPAPRFDRTPSEVVDVADPTDASVALGAWGLDDATIADLLQAGVVT